MIIIVRYLMAHKSDEVKKWISEVQDEFNL